MYLSTCMALQVAKVYDHWSTRISGIKGEWSCRRAGHSVQRGYVRVLAGFASGIAAVALVSAVAGAASSHVQVVKSLDRAVLTVGRKVADWQLSHIDNFDYIPAGAHRLDTEGRRDWIQAAFYIGLTQFADATGDARYTTAVLNHGTAEEWGFD